MSASDVHGRRNAVFPASQSQNISSVCGQNLCVLPDRAHEEEPSRRLLHSESGLLQETTQTRQSRRQSDTVPGRLSTSPPTSSKSCLPPSTPFYPIHAIHETVLAIAQSASSTP
ncbi:hypothetical protein J3459_010101 [Metarhizium acridum]|uniref:uncharacterized protein n=1 Tax=Metarhizium acridum TaxID=92637 RepID=UPI001C6C85E6|nr:hypothetical protein J3459_018541 [Metarhizium acridum]KAG8422716.1 hypothetical protein J3459_010101 [Metarhizium acridum]KAG8424910.1 hypothetical protein J3458_001664 [Metarhizium acridum]